MSYEVKFEINADGWWVVSVPDLPGCHIQGESLGHACERLPEAIDLWIDTIEDVRRRNASRDIAPGDEDDDFEVPLL
jgi:predicted RNase H-like HicB family nuclease